MTVTCDGFSFIYYRRPATVESLLSEVEDFRDTDVDTLILHAPGGDKVAFPSRYGQMPGQEMDDYLVAGHRYFAEAVRELAHKKINPVKVIIDGAHAAGLKVHVAVRPAGWSFVEPFTDFWETPFYGIGMKVYDLKRCAACVVSDDCGAWWPREQRQLLQELQLRNRC